MRELRKEDIESILECNRILKEHLDTLRKKISDQEIIIEFLGITLDEMNEELMRKERDDLFIINPN